MQAFKEKGVMFLVGFGVACMLLFSVGAAQRQVNEPGRYNADVVLGGVALKIVDNRTNTFYLYGISPETDSYVLSRTIDLNHAGQPEIKYVNSKSDDAKDK